MSFFVVELAKIVISFVPLLYQFSDLLVVNESYVYASEILALGVADFI